MKIDDHSDLSGISTPGAKGPAAAAGSGRVAGSRDTEGAGSDRAELSGLAGKIAQTGNVEARQRSEKVARLRLDVEQGRYQPDAAAISRGIVNDALSNTSTGGPGKK